MMKVGLNELMSDTRLLTRLVVLAGIVLVLAVLSFGAYYYYDRYYSPQPSQTQMTMAEAQAALMSDPQNNEKRMVLADLQLMNGLYDPAIQNAGQVMLSDPEHQGAWLILGVGYALKNQPAAAIDPLSKYVAANRDSDMPGLDKRLQAAGYYLGVSYLKLGQPEMALEPLELTVSWSKTDADAMYQLGLTYTALGKYEDALAMFHYAVGFVPDYREVYEGMADVYRLKNEPDFVNYAQGMAAYSQKQYDTAVGLLLKAIQGQPNFAPAFAGLGLAYEAQGKLQEAKDAYDAAYKLDPNYFTASNGSQRVGILLKK